MQLLKCAVNNLFLSRNGLLFSHKPMLFRTWNNSSHNCISVTHGVFGNAVNSSITCVAADYTWTLVLAFSHKGAMWHVDLKDTRSRPNTTTADAIYNGGTITSQCVARLLTPRRLLRAHTRCSQEGSPATVYFVETTNVVLSVSTCFITSPTKIPADYKSNIVASCLLCFQLT